MKKIQNIFYAITNEIKQFNIKIKIERKEEVTKRTINQIHSYSPLNLQMNSQKEKYLILRSDVNDIKLLKRFQIFLLYPLNIYSIYQFGYYLSFMFPDQVFAWLSISFFLGKFNYNLHKHLMRIIKEIYLLKNGKEVEIVLYNKLKKLTLNNSQIRKITTDEALKVQNLSKRFGRNFNPIMLKDLYYFIPKQAKIVNERVFSAILNSENINVIEKEND